MIGSLFSGVGGLELGLERATGQSVAWQCEYDKAASKVLADRWPDVPNLHDITTVDWDDIEPVGIVCGGPPCQPTSTAGQRKGEADDRWLWPAALNAVRRLHPRWVVFENPPALLTLDGGRPFGRILASLAQMGYVGRWGCVRASDIGAPHRRERLFLVATHSASAERRSTEPAMLGAPIERAAEPRERLGESVNWDVYGAAVRRWGAIHRPAPVPVDGRGRLSPAFVEWMMGFPPGHVTETSISRSAQLRCLGNAVVPACAEMAWQLLT